MRPDLNAGRKRVLIDLDGVLYDFTHRFTSLAVSLGLLDAPWSQVEQKEWQFTFDINPVWEAADSQRDWWARGRSLIDDDEMFLLEKACDEHLIYFVTSRRPTLGRSVEAQTAEWLEYTLGLDSDHFNVIACGEKGLICQALDITVALDDKVSNLELIADSGVLAVARRWNYNTEWNPAVASVGDFLEQYVLV